MTISNQLVVPIALWGNRAPTHCISAIFLTRNQKTIVTGCNDGRICVWDVNDKFKIVPRCLLFGHTAPVLCLTYGSNAIDSILLVSSSEAGEMSLWDLTDGRCLESAKIAYIHTAVHSYQMFGTNDVRLFCNGYYAEILVMDVLTLDILFTLSSRVNPDWISTMHILRPIKGQDDVIVGLSATGIVKVWTLSGNETKNEPVYEHESKPIRCLNAIKLTCCIHNQRTVLIVCSKSLQIYDALDFSLLCSLDNPPNEHWLGGDFISADKIVASTDSGKAYMYKLPPNCNADSKDFHSQSKNTDKAVLYCILVVPDDKRLLCPPPVMSFIISRSSSQRILLRGDSYGRVTFWICPDISDSDIEKLEKQKPGKYPEHYPVSSASIQDEWNTMVPSPAGILDQMISSESPNLKLTATVYLPLQGRLVCGTEDGSIIIISATQTVLLQLLYGKHQTYEDYPPHQLLHAHNGRVNCLLYPHVINNRYDIAHVLSGGVDFSVCLWDIYVGTLLHRFCVHAGEITQLIVPPVNCNNRVLQSICSVASDHSVALLALKDKKCMMLASRHLFPIQIIKFRPVDDYMIVGCSDGSVYVWQMETGHLDRYVEGLSAEEILSACDENVVSSGDRMTNPAIHLFRGLRHRNLAAIRHAAQRGLHQLHQPHHPSSSQHSYGDSSEIQKSRAQPLIIQGLRTNPKDQDSHVLFFDIEALVVQLLSEEYSSLSPGQLEVQGLINPSEQQKYLALSSSPEKKISGIIAKMKDTAENAAHKIQAKAESVRFKTTSGEVSIRRKDSGGSSEGTDGMGRRTGQMNLAEANLTMEIAQLLLSLLHAWGLDPDLDRVCESKLGLLRPMRPVCFGLLSRGGHMALILPTYLHTIKSNVNVKQSTVEGKHVRLAPPAIPPELVEEGERARIFTSRGHWELSTAMTTTHLLAVIALANTLMSMNSATFIPEQERRRKLHRRLSRADSKAANSQPTSPGTLGNSDNKSKEDTVHTQAIIAAEATVFSSQQAHIKQGWSLLAALHCVLLPDLVKSPKFKCPQVEMLARRWQDRCLEVREAAQALLLAELRRITPKGRKQLVEEWAPYLPSYGEPKSSIPHKSSGDISTVTAQSTNAPSNNVPSASSQNIHNGEHAQNVKEEDHSSEEEEVEDHNLEEVSCHTHRPSSATEKKRKQTTAIVLLGVIGAEYGHEIETKKSPDGDCSHPHHPQKRRSVVDGFGLSNYSLARHTSQALAFLLLVPPSPSFPAHTALRRAAIDLLGRGFTVWMPYLDVSKILLGLLELCCDSEKLVPSMSYGLPLTPAADSCRTARHALSLIALARPPAFITTLVKEVARFNTLSQNAQALNHSMSMTVLSRAKPEILRVVELLIDKMQTDVSDLIVEVMDIVIHCLDNTQLKARGLKESFPAICRFYNVTYCSSTRRIAVGSKYGTLAIYELRASKCQTISAHAAAINACAFSPDGKFLASYSNQENKLCFWQTATGLFGLGNAQTRCIRTYNTPLLNEVVKNNPLRMARLQWPGNKVVSLITDDNLEYRFSVT